MQYFPGKEIDGIRESIRRGYYFLFFEPSIFPQNKLQGSSRRPTPFCWMPDSREWSHN